MTIQDWGSIGELIAAIATVATLIYLAAQIRQNSKHTDATTEDAVASRFNDVNLLIASDPQLADLLADGLDDRTR